MLLALRHPRLWLVSGWLLIIVAVIANLMPSHDLPNLGGAAKLRALDVTVRTLVSFEGH